MRRAALFGTIAVVLWQTFESFPLLPRQWIGAVVVFIAFVAVPLVIRRFMPHARAALQTHPALLVPLGLRTLLLFLVNLMLATRLFAAAWYDEFTLWRTISITLSVGFLIRVVIDVMYAAWTTSLVRQIVVANACEPEEQVGVTLTLFVRFLLYGFVGHAILLLAVAPLVALGAAGSTGLIVAAIGMAAASLVWNVLSAPLYPLASDAALGIWNVPLAAWRATKQHWRGWLLPVVLQLVLLGVFVFVWVSYSYDEWDGDTRKTGSVTRTNWHVNATWTGGYEEDCDWYEKIMGALEQRGVPGFVLLLTLLYGVLAVAVKVEVMRRLC